MARIMGIDYGRRRTGVAVTDPLQIVAGQATTVATHELLTYVRNYVATEPVELIVVGKPTQLNGQPSENLPRVNAFVAQLRKALPDIPVTLYDERFTSTIAHRAMIDGGMKKSDRRDKARVDTIAATIILNDYLQHIAAMGPEADDDQSLHEI